MSGSWNTGRRKWSKHLRRRWSMAKSSFQSDLCTLNLQKMTVCMPMFKNQMIWVISAFIHTAQQSEIVCQDASGDSNTNHQSSYIWISFTFTPLLYHNRTSVHLLDLIFVLSPKYLCPTFEWLFCRLVFPQYNHPVPWAETNTPRWLLIWFLYSR